MCVGARIYFYEFDGTCPYQWGEAPGDLGGALRSAKGQVPGEL